MKYFNGFSLQGEHRLFKEILDNNDTTIVGFSYGAQRAIEYAYHTTTRIDKIILLSPAFFQTQTASFIRAQLRYFESDKESYINTFLTNVIYPSTFNLLPYLHIENIETLESLLCYQWEEEKINTLLAQGITIEVFFGSEDKIIDITKALKFFKYTSNYLMKDTGHLLRGKYD